MKLSHAQVQTFQEKVWAFFAANERDMPWRSTTDPYKIMVSELMLQQTQVARVIPKYNAFVEKFPDVSSLARASQAEVLRAWSGLGYNRRAKYLHQAAGQLARQKKFPDTIEEMVKLPGIGPNTAGAILVYAYNQPVLFIETNIRTVYIHEFFRDQSSVSDHEIKTLLQQTLDLENPRRWYYALMDLGSYLKKEHGNANNRSKHYKKQTAFHGSKRQIRGLVLKQLVEKSCSGKELQKQIVDERLAAVLDDLLAEGLVIHKRKRYMLG